MRFVTFIMILALIFSACKESAKNEIYNENNTTVINGTVYDTDERPINGIYRVYYDDGKIKMEINSLNGKPNGEGKFYRKDGSVSYICNFVDGKPNGVLINYYKNGNVHNELNYDNGVLNGEQKTFDKNGNIVVYAIFENGKAVSGYIIIKGEKTDFTPEELKQIETNVSEE